MTFEDANALAAVASLIGAILAAWIMFAPAQRKPRQRRARRA